MSGNVRVAIAVLGLLLSVPAATFAQSSIGGVVKDLSGAVLPGVTVEVSSPVLIEKVRSVVTDDQGLYRIVDLRPGVYSITISLPGFAVVKQEGLELPAGFNATQNVVLKVSDIQETVTVSAAVPTVDVQSVTKSAVFSKVLLENLPTASRTPQSFVAFVPGVTGGLNVYALQQKSLAIHNSRTGEADLRIDGFSETGPSTPGGTGSTFYTSPMVVQETNVVVSAHSAEFQMGGVMNNVIPKEGGNLFSGSAYVTYNDDHTSWSNFSDRLKAEGVTAVSGTQRFEEVAGGLGGPLIANKLWFFSSFRNNNVYRYLANLYVPIDPLAWVYKPDLSRPAVVRNEDQNYTLRLTWQATPKNKFNVAVDYQPHVNHQNGTAAATPTNVVSIEAATYTPHNPNYLEQVTWKSPATSHIYLEAGLSFRHNSNHSQRELVPVAVAPDTIAAVDRGGLVPGLQFRAANGGYTYGPNHAYSSRGSLSYVTGAHNAKFGFTLKEGASHSVKEVNQDITYTLNNGVPQQLTENATPTVTNLALNADLGIYGQDQWRIKRVTINAGLRYDYLRATALAADQPAGRFVPARSFGELGSVPAWHDLSPRLGTVIDLFGDGKTALKVSLSRYVAGTGTDVASANNPVTTAVTSATRSWNDFTFAAGDPRNGNYVPDCDFTIQAANGECGKISNVNFGSANPNATKTDSDVLLGYKKRGYNWETAVSLQHELAKGVSVDVGYFRRTYGNFTVTDNQSVSPSDYSPYCITAPVDSRLPANVSGQQLCGFYDVSVAKFGQSTNFTTFASHYGEQTEVYNGLDVSTSLRLPRSIQASGGVSWGTVETNRCFVVDSPGELRFCNNKTPFQPNFKFIAAVPLPWWGLQTSMALQSVPGPQETATFTATNAMIAPSLGRNLSAGSTATVNLELIQPGTLYGPRINQLDLRLAKTISMGAKKNLRASLNLYNVFNSDAVQNVNTNYSTTSAWPLPTVTLDGRFAQFSAQFDF